MKQELSVWQQTVSWIDKQYLHNEKENHFMQYFAKHNYFEHDFIELSKIKIQVILTFLVWTIGSHLPVSQFRFLLSDNPVKHWLYLYPRSRIELRLRCIPENLSFVSTARFNVNRYTKYLHVNLLKVSKIRSLDEKLNRT